MQPKILFVALDANLKNSNAMAFRSSPVFAKLTLLENHIAEICEQLKTIAPDALWIMGWAETAIENYLGQLALTPDEKKMFKETFKRLTDRYPNLAIVAGTIQTYKHTNDIKKVDQVLQYYQLHSRYEKEEAFSHATHIKDEKQNIIDTKKRTNDFDIIRNSCFVFYRKTIWCHDKATPVTETVHNNHLRNPIFQPAKRKNANPICKLIHPVTLEEIKIGIEICNEHKFSYLKNVANNDEIFLHLIVSATIKLNHISIYGKYTVQLDAKQKPVLILKEDEDIKNLPIQLYQSNFFKAQARLMGPLEPVYPLLNNILDKLDAAINKLPPCPSKVGLKALRSNIYVSVFLKTAEMNSDVLPFLECELYNNRRFFVNKHSANNLFPASPDLVKLLDELINLVQDDKLIHPYYSEIHPTENARLL